jgi:Leucine-rich repeat (LRR) protein
MLVNDYICVYSNLTVLANQPFVVHGDHLPGKSDSDVTVVDYKSSKLSEIPAEIFTAFGNLEQLIVKSTGLESLKPLKNCKNLREFKGSENKIQSLESEIFADCFNLQLIDLNSNEIRILKPLKNCQKLQKFLGSQSHIESLSKETFAECLSLEFIELKSNKIKKLPAYTFEKNLKLVSIDLSQNLINGISPCEKFQGFEKLMSVNLTGNKCVNAVLVINNIDLRDVQKQLSLCHSSWLMGEIFNSDLKPMGRARNEL